MKATVKLDSNFLSFSASIYAFLFDDGYIFPIFLHQQGITSLLKNADYFAIFPLTKRLCLLLFQFDFLSVSIDD